MLPQRRGGTGGQGGTDGAVEVLGVLEEEAHHHRHPLAVLGLGDAEHLRDQRRLPDPTLGMGDAVAATQQEALAYRMPATDRVKGSDLRLGLSEGSCVTPSSAK